MADSITTKLTSLATRLGTEFKTLRNSEIGDRTTLTTSAKTVVGALNELNSKPTPVAGTQIDDTAASTSKTFSSSKITSAISTAKADVRADILGGAGQDVDTLKEVADKLAADESVASALAISVGNRLRIDAAQSLTTAQQAQGRSNLNVPSVDDIGDTAADPVAAFNQALA